MNDFQTKVTKKKLSLIARNEMRKQNIDAWVVVTREENRDPLAQEFGLSEVTWRSAGIITSEGNYAVVGSFDVKAAEKSGIYDEVYGYGSEGAYDLIRKIAVEHQFNAVAIDESQDFAIADGLSAGMKRYLRRCMSNVEFVSSEDLAIALRGRMLAEEIVKMKRAIKLTEEILDDTQRYKIKDDILDKEVFEYIQKTTKERGAGFSWSELMDPSLCVGPIEPQHSAFDNLILKKGKLLRIGFGVKLDGYCSDLQRVCFLGSPPNKLREGFAVARQANDAAIKQLSPDTTGYEVDRAGRSIVKANGFQDFAHGLGHTLGRTAHEIGPVLSPRWRNRYGHAMDKQIGKNVVFTIEPTIFSKFGAINIEQDVLVNDDGQVVKLSKPMQEIIAV